MNVLTILCLGTVVAVSQAAELKFMSKPDSVRLPESAPLSRSQVPSVIRKLMGFSADVSSEWRGAGDLLKRPEAVAVVEVALPHESLHHLPAGVKNYNLGADEPTDFQVMEQDLKSTYPDGSYTFLDVSTVIKGTHSEELGLLTSIDPVKVKNALLAKELENLRTIIKWLHNGGSGARNGVPDVYLFRIEGAGVSSENSKAVKILSQELADLKDAMKAAYGENSLVVVVSSNPEIVLERVKRAASTPTPAPPNPHNIYNFYNGVYPAAFNIIFFISLTLGLSILFIGLGMWFMDPGKDSIIYRMTMTRAKKD